MKEKPVIIRDVYGKEVERYVSTKECARSIGISSATLTYRIRKGGLFKGCRFEYADKNDVVPLAPSFLKRVGRERKGLDYDRFRIIDYEVRNNRVCITPCPFRDGMNHVFVGSAKCEQCTSFRGRDREKHKIACNYNQWSKQTIKAWKEN